MTVVILAACCVQEHGRLNPPDPRAVNLLSPAYEVLARRFTTDGTGGPIRAMTSKERCIPPGPTIMTTHEPSGSAAGPEISVMATLHGTLSIAYLSPDTRL